MESNAFNGALYLDEREHEFTISLPSGIGGGDFTLQWRYYQNASTTTDHNENYVSVGGIKLLGWSEQALYSLGATRLSTGFSVGSWQEFAIIRSGGVLYFYHNGVKVASSSNFVTLGNDIKFHFGASSRAYSMMDELRVVNFAVAKDGAPYTPTAVPYDTNSVLVLPDSASPIADEFWKFDTSVTPAFKYDFTDGSISLKKSDLFSDWSSGSISSYSNAWTMDSNSAGNYLYSGKDTSSYSYNPDHGLVLSDFGKTASRPGFIALNGPPYINQYYGQSYDTPGSSSYQPPFLVMAYGAWKGEEFYISSGKVMTGTYTFSALFADGSKASETVSLVDFYSKSSFSADLDLSSDTNSLTLRLYSSYMSNCSVLTCSLMGNCDLVYLEAVPGYSANDHTWVSCVYDSTELQANTAAIQTAIPVHGYTVGGVRPTFPQRGDVWMPVEGSRVNGVYIYNGQAWEETNARYWTGERWIPIYAFDLVTLKDMWDISSSTGEDILPSITSDYSFWNWWKNAWNAFTDKLFEIFRSGSSSDPVEAGCEHTYRESILSAPTCTQKGSASYVCTKCGYSYTDVLDPLGHDWLMNDSVPDSYTTVVTNIASECTVTVPNFTEYAGLIVDGDPTTFWSSADWLYPVEVGFVFPASYVLSRVEIEFEHYEDRTWDFDVIGAGYRDGTPAVLCEYRSGFSANEVFTGISSGYWPINSVVVTINGTNGYAWAGLAEVRIYVEQEGDKIPGYDLYVCSSCREEYKDFNRSDPPGANDGVGDDEDSWSVLELLKALKDGVWKVVTGVVKVGFGGISGLFDSVLSIGSFFDALGDLSDQMNGGLEWTP